MALTTGSGIGTEAVLRGNKSARLLKFGRAKLAPGKAYIATAPMTVKANEDTTIAGIRLDRLFTATGSLSSCVFLLSVSASASFSGVSATCVRLGSMGQSRRVEIQRRLLCAIAHLKIRLDHGLMWLMLCYVSAVGLRLLANRRAPWDGSGIALHDFRKAAGAGPPCSWRSAFGLETRRSLATPARLRMDGSQRASELS